LTDLNRVRAHLPAKCTTRRTHRKEQPMLDVILVVVGLGFFALTIAYAYGGDRL
jgi:hypothetical protein